MRNRLKRFLRTVRCRVFNDHDWTSACSQGIPPTEEQLQAAADGSMTGFYDYAKMYCEHCGEISELSTAWHHQALEQEAKR